MNSTTMAAENLQAKEARKRGGNDEDAIDDHSDRSASRTSCHRWRRPGDVGDGDREGGFRQDSPAAGRTGVSAALPGSGADAFALLERFEAKLKDYPSNVPRAATELAKEWRTDRVLRRLQALMVVVDACAHLVDQRDR